MKWEIYPLEFQVQPSGIPPGAKLAASLILRLETEGEYPLPKTAARSLKEDLAKLQFTFLLSAGEQIKKDDDEADEMIEIIPFHAPQASVKEDEKGYLLTLSWDLPSEDLDELEDNTITIDYNDQILRELAYIHYVRHYIEASKPAIIEMAAMRSSAEYEYRKWCGEEEELPEYVSLEEDSCDFISGIRHYLKTNKNRLSLIEKRVKTCRKTKDEHLASTTVECPPAQKHTRKKYVREEPETSTQSAVIQEHSETEKHQAPPSAKLPGKTHYRVEMSQATELLNKSLDTLEETVNALRSKKAKVDDNTILENLQAVKENLIAVRKME